jgi:hypothetical protein
MPAQPPAHLSVCIRCAKVALAKSAYFLRMASFAHVASEEGLSYDKVSSRQVVANEDRGNNLFRIQ